MWTREGGIAVGVVLYIPDQDLHKQVIMKRGEQTGKGALDQINKFHRIRAIHDEMFRLGEANDWLVIEQRPSLGPRPIDLVHQRLCR
jgi:2-phosphoglycerate kinase